MSLLVFLQSKRRRLKIRNRENVLLGDRTENHL
jgi:hypothetical protein